MKIIIFLIDYLPFIISIGIIILTLILFLKQKLTNKFIIVCLIFLSTILILKAAAQTTANYYTWKTHPVSQYLLPPYQPINYFASYSYFHYFKNLINIFTGSAIIGLLLFYLNKYRNNILLENKEISLAALGALIAGWPGIIIYFFLIFTLMILAQILIKIRFKKNDSFRLQITPFIILSSLIIIIFNSYLIKLINLSAIK